MQHTLNNVKVAQKRMKATHHLLVASCCPSDLRDLP